MNPTKAQIEAAARAIFDKFKFLSGDRDKWENAKQETYREFAKAALTTAAEVGPDRAQEFYEAWVKTRDALERLSAEHKQLRTATIELCAQVADGYAQFYLPSNPSRKIAAAIRALKDKPPTDPNLIYPGKDLTNVFPEEGS